MGNRRRIAVLRHAGLADPAYARYWPPVTALVFAQLATFVLVSQHRSMGNEAAIRALIINLSGRLREQIAPPVSMPPPNRGIRS